MKLFLTEVLTRWHQERWSVQDPQRFTRAIWPESKSLVREQWAQMCPTSKCLFGEVLERLRRAWSVGEKRVLVIAGKRDLPKPPLEVWVLFSPLNCSCNFWQSFWPKSFDAPQPIPRCASGVDTDQGPFPRGGLSRATWFWRVNKSRHGEMMPAGMRVRQSVVLQFCFIALV